jgi:hypothetical protein
MISARLKEAAPRQASLHEYVRPERSGSRCELQPGKPAGMYEIVKIGKKDPVPGREIDCETQVRSLDLWLDFYHLDRARSFAHHSMLDGYRRFVVAEGTLKAEAVSAFPEAGSTIESELGEAGEPS